MLLLLAALVPDLKHLVGQRQVDLLERTFQLPKVEQDQAKAPQDLRLGPDKDLQDLLQAPLDPERLQHSPADPQSRSSRTRMSTMAMVATNGVMSQRTASRPRRLATWKTKAPTMPFKQCREATRTHRPKANWLKFPTLPTRTVFKRKVRADGLKAQRESSFHCNALGDSLPTPVPLPEEYLKALAEFEAAYATGKSLNCPKLCNFWWFFSSSQLSLKLQVRAVKVHRVHRVHRQDQAAVVELEEHQEHDQAVALQQHDQEVVPPLQDQVAAQQQPEEDSQPKGETILKLIHLYAPRIDLFFVLLADQAVEVEVATTARSQDTTTNQILVDGQSKRYNRCFIRLNALSCSSTRSVHV